MLMYPLLIFFYFSYFAVDTSAFLSKAMGKFCAKVISIYPLAQVEQDIIQTDIEMVKMNRYQEGVQGCMNITRSVGPVSAKVKAKVKTSGRYVNMMLDNMNADNVCTSESFSKFLGKYNNTYYDDDCIFQKTFTCLTPPFDMNATVHEYVDEVMYGEFLIQLWFQAEGRDIMGYEIVLELKDAMKCKH